MIPTLDIPEQQVGETSSQKTTETTSTEPQTSNRDPPSDASAFTYASPVEASYASLARSLACAAAAAAQAQFAGGFNEYTHEVPSRIVPSLRGQDNFASFQSPAGELEIPWKPVSAFSDWGSNRSSIAIYTPTPADQQEDPFEYDHTIIPDVSSYDAATGSPIPSYTPLYEEFAQFQAAIDRASQARAFPMTLVPASSLIRRRGLSPFFAEMPPPLHRHNSVPPEFVNASSSFTSAPKQIESTIEIQSTIATRRNHTGPTALGGFNFEPKFTTESAQIPRGSQSVDTATNKRKLSFEPSSTDNVMPSSRKSSVHELTAKEEGSPPPESNEASPAPASTQVPELDFSTTAVTPESASFCSNDIASLSAGKDFHALGLPQQQLYIPFEYTERDNEILSSFYSIPSENSSGSSGLGLKDTDSFPFEEFLNTDFPVCGDVTTKGGEAELTQRLEQHLAF